MYNSAQITVSIGKKIDEEVFKKILTQFTDEIQADAGAWLIPVAERSDQMILYVKSGKLFHITLSDDLEHIAIVLVRTLDYVLVMEFFLNGFFTTAETVLEFPQGFLHKKNEEAISLFKGIYTIS